MNARVGVLLLLTACDGVVEVSSPTVPDTSRPAPSIPGMPSTTPPVTTPTVPGVPPPPTTTPVCDSPSCDVPVASSRAVRLTHAQWERTVRDLLKLPALPGLAQRFTPDATSTLVFDTDGSGLNVSTTLFTDYQGAAEQAAKLAVQTPAVLTALLPSPWPTAAADRANAFVSSFGRRAFRRPLTTDEKTRYAALFTSGTSLTGETDAVKAGVQITVQAMLQSPNFLYRVQQSATALGTRVPLAADEVATRVSYALLDSMPDEALMTAASSGGLGTPEAVRAQIQRILSTADGQGRIDRFHALLFDASRVDSVKKDAATFPGLPATLAASMRADLERTMHHLTVESGLGLKALLTSPVAFVNADTAPLYGLTGVTGATPQKVELDRKKRSGLFTRLWFPATYAYATDVDSIHRGAFLNRRLLCAKLPPPPGTVPPLPPAASGTNRQRVEAHTGKGTCGAGCHGTFINPAGFAFEGYDAVGRSRDTDKGLPVDAKDSYLLSDGSKLAFDGAVDFQAQVAEQSQTHDCYAGNWLQFLYGRPLTADDTALVQRMGRRSLRDSASPAALIADLLSSPAFLTRPVEVSP
ncbi:MAG: DUF1592 domain-containing protein [Myxococcaceae bacterium]|nr:DUF1592 domain-containing protein [Myxococcaceae bacterium]